MPDKLTDPPGKNRQTGRVHNLQGETGYSFITYPNLQEYALAWEDLLKKDP